MDHVELKALCEQLLREGRISKAAALLSPLNASQIDRGHRRTLANLARRANLCNLGLRILTPAMAETPSAAESAEYAALLHRIGANEEAIRILEGVDANLAPEALLYLALCHSGRWDHAGAVAPLERYCTHPAVNGYGRALGYLNLFMNLVASEQFARARALIPQLENQLAGHPHQLGLLAQARAEMAVLESDFLEAERQIRLAELLLKDQSADHLFARKWRAVIHLITAADSVLLREVRRDALNAGEWEMVRDCDYQLLKFAGTQDLFNQLYAGTPVRSYREALVRMTNKRFKIPPVNLLGEGERKLDLTTGEINGEDIFSRKKTLHRVLVALMRDTYRPLRVGGLFLQVFPSQHFDVFTSPDRLHQLIFRLRAILRESGSPVEIVEDNQFYRAVVQAGWAVSLEVSERPIEPSHIARLRQIFGHEFFTPRSARETLRLTPSALRRLIRSALDANLLVQQGRGPACRYKIAG